MNQSDLRYYIEDAMFYYAESVRKAHRLSAALRRAEARVHNLRHALDNERDVQETQIANVMHWSNEAQAIARIAD